MVKSTKSDNQKKRGRPATGITPMTGVRFPNDLTAKIEAWAKRQPDKPTKAESIRRLVEAGLATAMPRRRFGKKAAADAAGMAERQIDRLGDPSATAEERQNRKRRLLKGPAEFRNSRNKKPPR